MDEPGYNFYLINIVLGTSTNSENKTNSPIILKKTLELNGNSHSLTKSATFLKYFFRGTLKERNRQNYISSEGVITQNSWNGINKNSNWKVRLKTLENLKQVIFN